MRPLEIEQMIDAVGISIYQFKDSTHATRRRKRKRPIALSLKSSCSSSVFANSRITRKLDAVPCRSFFGGIDSNCHDALAVGINSDNPASDASGEDENGIPLAMGCCNALYPGKLEHTNSMTF